MLDLGMTVLSGACGGLAIICAAHTPRDGRWEAVSLACLLLVNWALFILAYTDFSPSWALERTGVDISSPRLWMLADAICGSAAITVAYRFWWGRALWCVSMVQIGFHAGMDAKIFDPVFYTDVLLNGALLVQLAIFFVMGGPGVGNALYLRATRIRLLGGSARAIGARGQGRDH